MDLQEWTLDKLKAVKENPRVVVRDSLRLLPEQDGMIHAFGRDNGYAIIVAATNLVFRQLYELATADREIKKILVIDRTPARRRSHQSLTSAPPPFYPDLLAVVPEEARINLDLRQFLIEETHDPNWTADANEPQYARLIARNLDGVRRAHQNLRATHPTRFTDSDFKSIVAFAALGVPDSAFKKLAPKDYWRIGLINHEALEQLDALTPEVTKPIRDELAQAPVPFCWFSDQSADLVIRAFYLSAILAQHLDNWSLLLTNIDPNLKPVSNIPADKLNSIPELMALDPEQAHRDLLETERSLNNDALKLILIDQIKLADPKAFTAVIEKEKYSTLIRSLALLAALDNLLADKSARDEHARILSVIMPEGTGNGARFVDKRPSDTWSALKDAYVWASQVQTIRDELANVVKTIKVTTTPNLTFRIFRESWNDKRLNRLEYFLSALERQISSGDFLPRPEDELPSAFGTMLARIKQRVTAIANDTHKQLDELNRRFQEMITQRYPTWLKQEGDVLLTSQFLKRCLKSHWDPQTEKAVVLIFDGMRYDIWDEMLRTMLTDRMEIIQDYPASSLLPSETHITRKAISAGTFPDQFDSTAGEDRLLKDGLGRIFGTNPIVEVLNPEGSGTGETVRYRAGNLDVYIFELCDKELHKIEVRTLPDGRQVPSRPLAFVYQSLKNLIDTEVMAIIRRLTPGTKVFVTADHGFGRVARDRIWTDQNWLNEPDDCSYLNARLKVNLNDVGAPRKVRDNVWEFPVADLRMPSRESGFNSRTRSTWEKHYATIIFPKTGFALARPTGQFNPNAYSHGGISIQELVIPMVVLQVKPRDEGLITLDAISGPAEAIEGEEIEFRVLVGRSSRATGKEMRVDVEASYRDANDRYITLPHQVLFVESKGTDAVFRFRPKCDDATAEERRSGKMQWTFTLTVSYRDERRTIRTSQARTFAVQLNSEKIVRRVGNLGNILGLTPKSVRG
jgi:hypothetical protein